MAIRSAIPCFSKSFRGKGGMIPVSQEFFCYGEENVKNRTLLIVTTVDASKFLSCEDFHDRSSLAD